MKQTKQTSMMTIATLAASVAVGGVVIQGILGGGNAALTGATGTAKTFTFCDGTATATSFTDVANKGEIHNDMMTATTCTDTTGLQLGKKRKDTGYNYDYIVVWDAVNAGDIVTFFVSANNITSVSTVAESSSWTDGKTKCSFTFTGYPNSMSFTAGATVDYSSLVSTLGTGTPYASTTSASGATNILVTTAAMSNVKTVAFQITAIATTATAHFKSFTVNWSC